MSIIYDYTDPRIETIGCTRKPIVLSSVRLKFDRKLESIHHAADQQPSDENNMKP